MFIRANRMPFRARPSGPAASDRALFATWLVCAGISPIVALWAWSVL